MSAQLGERLQTMMASGRTRREVLRGMGVLAGAVALGGVSACSGSGGAARSGGADGDLVVYSSNTPEVQRRVVEGFTNKTGIRVQSVRLTTPQLAQRFVEEQRAGRQDGADIIAIGDELIMEDLGKRGMLRSLTDVDGYSNISPSWNPQENYVLYSQAPATVIYNTLKLSPDQVSRGWEVLLDPPQRGQIAMADPRNNPVVMGKVFMAIASKYGDDWFEELGRQQIQIAPNGVAVAQNVAAGGAGLGFPGYEMNLAPFRGTDAPIATVPGAPEPSSMLLFFLGIAKNSARADKAKAWASYILSEEGQYLVNDGAGCSIYGTSISGSLALPNDVPQLDASEAQSNLPHYLNLLGIGA